MADQEIPKKMLACQVLQSIGPHDLLLKTAVASLCHTDSMVQEGTMAGTTLPITASHEGVGTVVAKGEAVTKFALRDRVLAGIPFHQCWQCEDCNSEHPQYCSYRTGGIGLQVDGAFAEYILIDSRSASLVPDALHFTDAAPLACAGITVWRALLRTELKAGDWLGIVGSGGGLGHLAVQFAKAKGLRVVGLDARDEGISLSRESGAEVVVDVRSGPDSAVKQVWKATQNKGVSATINLSDAASAAALACAVTRKHGRMVQVAQPIEVNIPHRELIFRDICVVGSLTASPKQTQEMLEFAVQYGLEVKTNVYHGLREIPTMVKDAHSGLMKAGTMDNKKEISMVEDADLNGESIPQLDEAEFKKILRRIDLRLIPLLSVLYLLSFLDRGNVGNANVAGLSKDLHLTGTQYNIALTMFFIPYGLFEVPSNILLKILKPRVWIPIIMLSWGTIMTLMGIVQSYAGLVVARVFLGIAELRMGYFYGAGALSGAFSGLLAFAIEKMDGVGGLAGWRWIFIIEGLLTVVVAVATPFLLPNDPMSCNFLNDTEKKHVVNRLREFQQAQHDGESDPFKWEYFWQAFTDWKIWMSILVYWGNAMPIYGWLTMFGFASHSFIYTLPVVIDELGYSATNAQLLTIPVYIAAVIATVTSAYFSDRLKTRSPFIIIPQLFGALGLVIVMAIPKERYPGAVYGALFIVAIGLYTTITGVVSWNANNLAGTWKRNIGLGLQISIGNLGGAVGTNIYLKQQAPNYWLGFGFSLGILLVASSAGMVMRVALQRINKKRESMSREEILEKYTPEELDRMGDKSPLFIYTL
ncbi:uncharacterized protein Triagg1_8387 [Trichoderma aggressivum f. europaeum]|uniref:Enoyl reductase (ER) domain-containing protein n=1 Tax=Trichoderma aggressivum f. europaeum TaxID=173218 RepID=A0AAE1J0J9_9HYPO|nr:hypothetical protein Triagg1_8387 [Trichoderma aggressivum f. europaeum]